MISGKFIYYIFIGYIHNIKLKEEYNKTKLNKDLDVPE